MESKPNASRARHTPSEWAMLMRKVERMTAKGKMTVKDAARDLGFSPASYFRYTKLLRSGTLKVAEKGAKRMPRKAKAPRQVPARAKRTLSGASLFTINYQYLTKELQARIIQAYISEYGEAKAVSIILAAGREEE